MRTGIKHVVQQAVAVSCASDTGSKKYQELWTQTVSAIDLIQLVLRQFIHFGLGLDIHDNLLFALPDATIASISVSRIVPEFADERCSLGDNWVVMVPAYAEVNHAKLQETFGEDGLQASPTSVRQPDRAHQVL
jgi:hypothetical protein